jgi:DnaD/phage-associated family protein
MEVKKLYSYIFADTLVSDIFLGEYLPLLDSDAVKIYIYMLYISKKGKSFSTISELSSIINIDKNIVEEALKGLTEKGLLSYVDGSYIITDIKEKEINRLYSRKENTKPSEIDELSIHRKDRNKTLDAINNMFFKGVMAPSWYTKVDTMYEKYKFDHDVMLQLFQQCHENNALNPNYVNRVAQSWYDKEIKTNFDLEKYYMAKEKIMEMASYISKKLKFMRMLTDYEMANVEKWLNTYKYTKEIIDFALEKTINTTKPSLKYIDVIISSWFDFGYKTLEEIQENDKKPSLTPGKTKKSFEERDYEEKDIEDLYYDPFKKSGEKL